VLGGDYLIRAWRATGQGKLPILWLEGRAISDPTQIIAALEERVCGGDDVERLDDLRLRQQTLHEFSGRVRVADGQRGRAAREVERVAGVDDQLENG
jgi:hypothetical protein